MDIKAYKKAVDRTGKAQATVTNMKEFYFIGNADKVVHTHSTGRIKFRWNVPNEVDWYKFTHLILHVEDEIYGAYEVRDLHLAPDTGKLELIFDYEV